MTRYLINIFFAVSVFYTFGLNAQSEQLYIKGRVVDEKNGLPVEGVSVKLPNTLLQTFTDKRGAFGLQVPRRPVQHLLLSHISYEPLLKEIRTEQLDTITTTISLFQNYRLLDSMTVVAVHKPETLVGKPNYSIYDFDFYEDKLLLLTAGHSLNHATLQFSDYDGKIISAAALPKQAGEAKHFFHDYEGYTDVVCNDSVFRLDVFNNSLMLLPVNRQVFERYLLPIADTMSGNYYYSDRWDKYPAFNYYYLKARDTLTHVLNTVSNADLMKLYNLEYYYLPSRMQLEARRMADYYRTDPHIIAALMSGFTQSMYFEPLYAPLFILKDTICIFNHHNDRLYHYNRQNALIDSVKITYHHPKNWREWKKQLFVDEAQNKVYAFFSKDGHHYLKQIDYQSGKEVFTYKLKHHSAEKIKIRNGYVYYVYRPFGSTQERFLYRERIE